MKEVIIGKNQAGQRLDKFLHKLLPEAGNGFLYKMLRKKNITLNGKKADGRELLSEQDCVTLFFSDETFEKFSGSIQNDYKAAYHKLKKISIVYEDENVLIANKPAGVLSQKAAPSDLSLNEWLIGYLLAEKKLTEQDLTTFRPSVCNRLDRNTSGLVLCGKSLPGSQEISALIQNRSIRKFYRTIVMGQMHSDSRINGYLYKDSATNKVTVKEVSFEGSSKIETAYHILNRYQDSTFLEVELITGKPHQIRAHLSSIGHPLMGDGKYGDRTFNLKCQKEYDLSHHLLHAYRLEMPELSGTLSGLSGQIFTAEIPAEFEQILNSCNDKG